PTRPQVEQVDEVRRARDHPRTEQHVPRSPGRRFQQYRGGQAARTDAHDLDQATRDPALPQRAEMPAKAFGGVLRTAADQLAVPPAAPRADPAAGGGRPGGPGPAARGAGPRRAAGERGPAGQADGTATEVRTYRGNGDESAQRGRRAGRAEPGDQEPPAERVR